MFTSMAIFEVPKIFLLIPLVLYNTPSITATSVPLLLTPYIIQENITTARELSLVVDPEGVIPKSYAGFITVDRDVGNHLFFWFFPVIELNHSAPLLIWLNGGPGESSMLGLFLENGPIQLGKSNSGETIYKKRNNNWANKFSMLYIDNPVGVGYSYSDDLARGNRTTQDGYTKDLYEFIQQFYQMFPEFLEIDLYIGGQSYAGKYVPALASSIHRQLGYCGAYFPLKGIYLASPLIDPSVQVLELFDLYYQLGYISYKQLKDFKENMKQTLPRLVGREIQNLPSLMFKYTGGNFHEREFLDYDGVYAAMTSDKIRSLLHVGNATFDIINYDIHLDVNAGDFKVSSLDKLTELIEHYKVLIFNGDLDGIISASGIEALIQTMKWPLWSAYDESTRVPWMGVNGTLKGFYNRFSSFCRVVLRLAGHRTGLCQPDNTLEMMENFVANGCVG